MLSLKDVRAHQMLTRPGLRDIAGSRRKEALRGTQRQRAHALVEKSSHIHGNTLLFIHPLPPYFLKKVVLHRRHGTATTPHTISRDLRTLENCDRRGLAMKPR
jgi:hypothetical protein